MREAMRSLPYSDSLISLKVGLFLDLLFGSKLKNGSENRSGSTRLKPLKRLNRLIRYGRIRHGEQVLII